MTEEANFKKEILIYQRFHDIGHWTWVKGNSANKKVERVIEKKEDIPAGPYTFCRYTIGVGMAVAQRGEKDLGHLGIMKIPE